MEQLHVIESLIKELSDNRSSMKDMLVDVIEFRKQMESLLPKKVDYRNKFMMEERMKLVTNIINAELSIRKQIDDNAKNEINIRGKIEESMDGERISRTQLEQIVSAIEHKSKGVN